VSQHLDALTRKGFLTRVGRRLMLAPEARGIHGIPIVGRVAAGLPITAIENYEGYLNVDSLVQDDATYFAVRVKGDSMADAGILDGDYVIVRQQEDFKDGDIVVAYVGDDPEATVKVIRKRRHSIDLQPRSEGYEPIKLHPGRDRFRIGGKVGFAMIVERLDEKVRVRADFSEGSIKPLMFVRRGQIHRVVRVNCRWLDREGTAKIHYFSVTSDSGDVYQLHLNTDDMTWHLDQVMMES